jgi:two-component system, CAI-1 autoinducer sensor kinase/phosphatase CqsS
MKLIFQKFFMHQPLLLKLREEIFDPEMETMLQPTRSRLIWLGISLLVGHPLFWYVWTVLFPQPYENLGVRLCLASLSLVFFATQARQNFLDAWSLRIFSFTCWIMLPVFFAWMYLMNGGNSVWLASLVTIILLYFQLTDWRMATIGTITGVATSCVLVYGQFGSLPITPVANIFVLVFALFVSIALAASSANLRRERLHHSLAVIGIMAHELRTPLATASLIGQAILSEASNNDEATRVKGLTKLANKLESLTRSINHHIDLQMMNARFMQLPQSKQLVSAHGLVNKTLKQYPFSSPKEQQCIEVVVHDDFMFFGSERQFLQVLNNLLKNSLYSLKAIQSRFSVGDLRIELGHKYEVGRITISDKGIGIQASHLSRIFEPFFSTNQETGHGLGLAYCRQVVHAAGGFIRVKSTPAYSAIFTIDLPIQEISSGNSNHALSSISAS